MEEKNEKISAFQFVTICAFVADALFVGVGIINIFTMAKQDAWIVNIISLFTVTIFVLLLLYITNYKPEKNILEKNKIIFGKIIGNIINLLLCACVFLMLIIASNGGTAEAATMYLTKTPTFIITSTLIFTGVYAVIKGIETIGRTSEILFYLAIIIVGIIVTSLFSSFNFNNLKPILPEGFKPLIKYCFIYFTYTISPLFVLGIIPKNNIINSKKFPKCFIMGVAVGILLMFFVFFLIPGVITKHLASLYRLPAYFVLRRVNIGGVIDNAENFLFVHWFFNTILMIMMSIYFISKYIESIFKIKKKAIKNIVSIVIGVITIIVTNYSFMGPLSVTEYAAYSFPYTIPMFLLFITIISCIIILFKKHKEKRLLKV